MSTVDTTVAPVAMPTAKAMQLKPLTEAQAKARNLPSTSKAKCRLGIADSREIVWAPCNFELEDHQNLLAFARSRDIPAHMILAAAAMAWFEDNAEAIYAEAEDLVKAESTAEDLTKQIAALNRSLERKLALLEARSNEGDDSKE